MLSWWLLSWLPTLMSMRSLVRTLDFSRLVGHCVMPFNS